MNKSKIRDPRFWERWRAAGAVETIEAAQDRANRPQVAWDVETVPTSNAPSSMDDWMAVVTVPAAAEALGVHQTTVRRRLARGTYQGTRDDAGVWSITDPEIVALVLGVE